MSSTLSPHLQPGPDSGRRCTINRLKRAKGQLIALIAAVESGADCRNVITQLTAVRGALDKTGFELISTAMRDCLTGPADVPAPGAVRSEESGRNPTLEEIRALFLRLT
jgi:DNA-binding FrmR family transcriptional regulator